MRIRLTTPHDPKHNPGDYRKRASAYRQRMQRLVKARRPGPLTDVLKAVLPRVARWEERVGQLAGRLQAFEGDALNRRDVKEVPKAIAQLERQIPMEADPQVRQQMVSTLNGYRAQQAQLTDLARVMRRTRLQLDDTLASMGTIYSQVHMIDALDIDSPKAARIAGEIEEQVQRLNDLLAALPESYAGANLQASTLDARTDAATGIGTGAAGGAGLTRVENDEIATRRARLEHEASQSDGFTGSFRSSHRSRSPCLQRPLLLCQAERRADLVLPQWNIGEDRTGDPAAKRTLPPGGCGNSRLVMTTASIPA